MRKFFLLLFLVISTISLSSCFIIRERILAPPDEIQIPEGSSQAVCTKDEIIYKYVYQNDGVYQFFVDNLLQEDDLLNIEQEQVFLHDESVINYLNDEYGENNCIITNYIYEDN